MSLPSHIHPTLSQPAAYNFDNFRLRLLRSIYLLHGYTPCRAGFRLRIQLSKRMRSVSSGIDPNPRLGTVALCSTFFLHRPSDPFGGRAPVTSDSSAR